MEIEVLRLTENYLNKFKETFCEYELKEEEKKTLRLLTQLDLLIIEQYYLDKFKPTLNINTYAGTKLGTITPLEVKSKISLANREDRHYTKRFAPLSQEKKDIIATGIKNFWKGPKGKELAKDISKFHGSAVIALNSELSFYKVFNSYMEAAKHFECERKKISRRVNKFNPLWVDKFDSKFYFIVKEFVIDRAKTGRRKPIVVINTKDNSQREFLSIREAERALGLSNGRRQGKIFRFR